MIGKLTATATLLLLTGCGQYYWEAPGRGETQFRTDNVSCIREAIIKYDVASERIYRACMKSRGWDRVLTAWPGDHRFRGPEGDDELHLPPA